MTTTTPPSVSVVIPTRDRPQLLRRAIRGIITQDYPGDLEIIVVFDQSEPDESLERHEPGRRVRVTRNERTPGLAGGRNTGIIDATGDLIAFCDDDDEWLPGKLAAQVTALGDHDGPAIAACGIYVRREGKTTTRLPDETKLRYEDFLEDRIMEVNPCTILLPRTLLDKVGLVDEDLPGSYAEDYELLLRLVAAVPIVVVPQPLVLIHWGVGSFFAERWQMIHDAIDDLVAKHPDLRTSDRGYARLRGQQAFALAGMGRRREAFAAIRETLGRNPREPRAALAALVASGALSATHAVNLVNRTGRGI
ncbi:MAG: glycosyltransferase family 2 protein [Acidimicrobiales bacterium]